MTITTPIRILVLDDDADTVEALRIVLESGGYEVLTAQDAVSAIAVVHQGRPDLILADVMLPSGTEGFHFVWKLRQDADASIREVPVIIISAIHDSSPFTLYPESSDNVYGPNEYLPVQAFLDKPVQPAQLLREIARLLATRGESPDEIAEAGR